MCLTVAGEAVLAVIIGSALGIAVAGIALLGGLAARSANVPRSVDLVVPWSTITAATATCLILAVLASVLPARRSSAARNRRLRGLMTHR